MNRFAVNLISKAAIIAFVFFAASFTVFGQDHCFTDEEAKTAVNLINTSTQEIFMNKALRDEILKMKSDRLEIERRILENWDKNQALVPTANEMSREHLLRLCEIIKQNGWVRRELIGDDGFAAAMGLIQGNRDVALEREFFPVLVAAAKKDYVGNNYVADLIDSIRVGTGLPQIFGTQTRIKDELFYLYPLLNEAKVDEWRKIYNLPSLANYMRYLQFQYGMPVIKSPRAAGETQVKEKSVKSSAQNEKPDALLNLDNNEEVVKVESSLVNLNVRVFANDASSNFNLQKEDFTLFQDGKQQDISFFSAADAPFDLVLLLDLSGSTSDKQDLIRKSTKNFIEAARPSDRIAIITFTDEPRLVSDLTQDKTALFKSVKKIDDAGGSGVWGAIQFAFDKIIKPESQGRRSAILIMTDGVDSALLPRFILNGMSPNYQNTYPIFSDLLDTIRGGDTTVIPIYLDTETRSDSETLKSYRQARRTLSMLAEESGGQMYYAKKVNDLTGVYQKVINDLSKVYSLGYEPGNSVQDGAWHSLEIKLPNHPELNVRTKTGFYAK